MRDLLHLWLLMFLAPKTLRMLINYWLIVRLFYMISSNILGWLKSVWKFNQTEVGVRSNLMLGILCIWNCSLTSNLPWRFEVHLSCPLNCMGLWCYSQSWTSCISATISSGALIHDVFHISLLRKHLGDKWTPLAEFPPITNERCAHHLLLRSWITVQSKKVVIDHIPKFWFTIKEQIGWRNLEKLSSIFPCSS